MKQTDINILMKEDVWDLIGKQWMLISAGTAPEINTMTASWGGIGWLWNKPVAFLFIRPERHTHMFVEANQDLTISFLPEEYREALRVCGTISGRDTDKIAQSGLTPISLSSASHPAFEQSRLTLVGRKLFKTPMTEDAFIDRDILAKWYNSNPGGSLHDIYVVEITEAWIA